MLWDESVVKVSVRFEEVLVRLSSPALPPWGTCGLRVFVLNAGKEGERDLGRFKDWIEGRNNRTRRGSFDALLEARCDGCS